MFYLLIDKLINDSDEMKPFIRRAAKDVKYNRYLTAGEFFDKLSDDELNQLNEMVDKIKTIDYSSFIVETEEDNVNLMQLMLLCSVLSLGEGMPELSPESMRVMMSSLTALCTAETMHRNGDGVAVRSNFSLFEQNLEVIRRKK
jgi:hypothetical protein